MTPLRQAMIEAMTQRGFSIRTHRSYLSAVEGLAKYYHRSPDRLTTDEIQGYFVYLVQDRQLAPASCRLALNGVVFLYRQVLHQTFTFQIQIPKRPERLPELLTHKEVDALLTACVNHKHRMMLTTCYGCGLRVSELVHLRVRDIDSERLLLRIDQGKGKKDRLVEMPPTLLDLLRDYWRVFRPFDWLFTGRDPTQAISVASAQRSYTVAKRKTAVDKLGGIHGLRHAYATHQLAAGMPLVKLQHQLGHKDIRTTMRYLHWVPHYAGGEASTDLLVDLETASAH